MTLTSKIIQVIFRKMSAKRILGNILAMGVIAAGSACGSLNAAPSATESQTIHAPIASPTAASRSDMQVTGNPPAETREAAPTATATFEPTVTMDAGVVLDPKPSSFPAIGFVKDAYENGDYKEGLANAAGWVALWLEMGVFEGKEVLENGLNPVPIDGNARIVCVDTKGKSQYAGKLLCPPLDAVNGGLKPIPDEGSWDESDLPVIVNLNPGIAQPETLITKGVGTGLGYQIVEKYDGTPYRYYDPKTGDWIEGNYESAEPEVKLPEIIPEQMNPLEDFSFHMEFIDPKKTYRQLLELVVGNNLDNQIFWSETLGIANPSADQFLAFARNNIGGPENKAYWLAFETRRGTRFNYLAVTGLRADIRRAKPQNEGIYLDGIYSMIFIGGDLIEPDKALFFNELKRANTENGLGLRYTPGKDNVPGEEFGTLILNNRLVYISANEMMTDGVYGKNKDYILGGPEGVFRADFDIAIVSAQMLTYIRTFKAYDPRVNYNNKFPGAWCTFNAEDCRAGIFSGSLDESQFLLKEKP